MAPTSKEDGPARVLHLIASLGAGGAERQLSLLVRYSDPSSTLHAVSFYEGGPYEAEVRAATPHVYPLERGHRFSASVPVGILRVLRDFRPDIVQTWLSYMDIVGPVVTRLRPGIPILASERNTREQYELSGRPAIVRVRNWTRRHLADAVVTNSESGRDYLQHDVGIEKPIEVIRNALEIEAIDHAEAANLESAGAKGSPLLLSVGRLTETKNLTLTLAALPKIAQEHPNVGLVVCGTGPLRQELERYASSLGIEERVSWLGFRKDVWSLMKSCDVLVHAARSEGDPNVVAEAAAARLPLCISSIGPHREFGNGRDAATFFDPESSDALALAVLELLADGAKRGARIDVARELAEDRSPERFIARYADLYRRYRRAP